MAFEILDHLSKSSELGKVNDDWLAYNNKIAIVADGATGLSERRFIPDGASDAQWIAKNACARFVKEEPSKPVNEIIEALAETAIAEVEKTVKIESVPRYAWPAASFIMARLQNDLLEFSGLGDCTAYVRSNDDTVTIYTAMPVNRQSEARSARQDLKLRKSRAEAIRTPEVVQSLRKKRSLHNTEQSGVWTLGLVSEAASHTHISHAPFNEVSEVLLMSDGFSAICEAYEYFDEAELIKAACKDGLEAVYRKIREIECEIDPKAERFPRYKQCDDSSAILLKVTQE